MNCEYCSKKEDDLYLFVLPCGYSVCYDHLTSQDESFNCFVCQDHVIEKQSCFRMKKNEKKLKMDAFLTKKKSLLNLCDQIEKLQMIDQENDNILQDKILVLKKQINLKRVQLKTQLNKLIDEYHVNLMNELKNEKSEFLTSILDDLDKIDIEEMRKLLNSHSQENLNEFKFKEIEKELVDFMTNFNKLTSIEFVTRKNLSDFNLPKIFGHFCRENFHQLSNNFKFIHQFGLKKFEELNNGEVVSTSFSDPSKLIIFNPQNGQIREISETNEIKFLFKSYNDEIITIDSEFHVKIRFNWCCIETFDLARKNLIYAELVEDKIVTISEDYFVTVIKYYNGEILYDFYFTTPYSSVKLIKAFYKSTFIILIEVQNQYNGQKEQNINKIDFRNKILKTFKCNIGNNNQRYYDIYYSTIERLNENEFVTGSSNGELCIWNSDLSVKLKKKCHSSAISGIMLCEDGNIVSISSQDGIIKIWNSEDLSLICQSNSIFFKLNLCILKMLLVSCRFDKWISGN
ncbi:hypothetical protein BpHYR1_003319 [Brachionus plicatilis]|uniref:Uncharacterized protein n=1 Tax=Brachionus plicatilis TaxID=10195 RepID=A0A3M7T2P3_BRAPC|nr:hypothetical protein BpHYR1_003319 [Brachionus plicatilis]